MISARNTLARGALISALFYPISILSGLVWNMILARSLVPAEVGLYALGMTILGISSVLANHGMAITAQRYLPLLEEHGDQPGQRFILWLTVLAPLLGGIIVGFLLVLLQDVFESWFYPGIASVVVLIAILLPLHASFSSVIKIFLGKQMPAVSQLLGLIGMKVFPAIIILFWFGLKQEGTAVDAVWAFLFGTGIVLLWGWGWIQRSVLSWFGTIAERMISLSDIYRFSIPMTFSGLFAMMVLWTDTLFLGVLGDESSDIAYYNMAYYFATLVRTFALMLPQTLLLPVLMKKYGSGDESGMIRIYSALARFSFFVAVPIGAILIFYGESLLGFAFGDIYKEGSTSLMILAMAFIISAFFGHASMVATAFGHVRWILFTTIVVLAVNIIGNWWLIPVYGIEGAAAATAFSEILMAVLMAVKLSKAYWKEFSIVRMIAVIASGFFIFFIISSLLGAELIVLLAGCLLGGLVYLVFLWFGPMIPEEDKKVYAGLIKNMVRRFGRQ